LTDYSQVDTLGPRSKVVIFRGRQHRSRRPIGASACLRLLRSPTLRLLQVSGFGFRISGFGMRVSGSGLGVASCGLRVSGFGIWGSGFGFRVFGFGFWASIFLPRVSGFEFRDQRLRIEDQDLGYRVRSFGFEI